MSIFGLIVAIILAILLFNFLDVMGGVIGLVLVALAIWFLVGSRRGTRGDL